MNPPRPTMTADDVRKLREFFDSPAGKRMLGQINHAFDVWPIGDEPPESFWRDARTGERLEIEAASSEPFDPLRPFPSPPSPEPEVDHRVSAWPFILVTILSTVACAAIIGWFVSAALKAHS